MLEIQRHLWSPDLDVNDAYFAWKYERNPSLSEPLAILVLDGDRVVGMRGAFGSPWVVEPAGHPLQALCAGDAVVAPDHRGRGLATRITEALASEAHRRGWNLLINTSSGGAVRHLSLKSGWREVGEIRPLALWWEVRDPVPPERFEHLSSLLSLAARLRGRPSRAHEPLLRLDRRVRRAGMKPGSAVSVSREPLPQQMAALAASVPARGTIRERRDASFFEWRFSNPLCSYRFFFLAEGQPGQLAGYAVLHAHGPEHDTGINLVDWEASTPEALTVLLEAIRHVARNERITTWPTGADPRLVAVLAENGFRSAPAPEPPAVRPALLVLPLRETETIESREVGGADPLKLENWDLRMTASDFY